MNVARKFEKKKRRSNFGLECLGCYAVYFGKYVQKVWVKLWHQFFFLYFADRASQYIYLNINQLDALDFQMSLFHASTYFEHMCSSSGGQNCTIQPLVSSHSVGGRPVHGTATYRCDGTRYCIVQF